VIRLMLRDLRSRKLRTALTTLAILLGVAMISGTYVLTDQINKGFKDIEGLAYSKVDVTVTPKAAFGQALYGPAGFLPQAMVGQIKSVNGVAEALGYVYGSGSVVVNGKVVTTGGAPTIVYSYIPPRFEPDKYVSGAPPSAHGEAGVIKQLADAHHLHVGQTVGLTTAQGVQSVRISGIFTFADSPSMGGATVVHTTLADAQNWYQAEGKLSQIYVAATPGVNADTLVKRLRGVLPSSVEVKSGQQTAAQSTKAINDSFGKVLRTALLAFGGVAVIVGAFIIFNAFSITVAQRLREFAMLRSLGASRRQVLTSVMAEALMLGVAASLLGIGAGLGVAKGINGLFKAVGADIPTSGIVLAPRTVVISLAVGIGVALLAALIPALRATRVPPVAALQEGATLPQTKVGRYSAWIAGGVAVAGVAALIAGMVGHAGTTQRLTTLGMGVVLIFIAVAMVAKYVVRPLASVVGWPLAKVFGTSGRLARENAGRNPARTAATAAALMIGLAVVVFVAVFAEGLKGSFVSAVDREVQAALVVTAKQGDQVPLKAFDAVRALPSVQDAAAIATQTVQVNSKGTSSMFAINPAALSPMWRFHWLKGGSDQLLGRLTGPNVIIEEQFATSRHLAVGGHFRILTIQGRRARFTVIGIYRDPTLATGFTVAQTTFDTLYSGSNRDPFWILATVPSGADVGATKAAVKSALQAFPTVQVQTKAQYTDQVKKGVNQILSLLYALLAVSVTISVFGIVNTLVLSVYERTREIGMLRAIGTSRRQMRRIVRYESVITSVIGGILGTALGVVFAYVVTTRFASQGITFTVPYVQLVLFLLAAGYVGVAAAVLPARRAARVDILEAIHYE
jgi:putative ABC transport system permease protein